MESRVASKRNVVNHGENRGGNPNLKPDLK